jgi:hypothetical protein
LNFRHFLLIFVHFHREHGSGLLWTLLGLGINAFRNDHCLALKLRKLARRPLLTDFWKSKDECVLRLLPCFQASAKSVSKHIYSHTTTGLVYSYVVLNRMAISRIRAGDNRRVLELRRNTVPFLHRNPVVVKSTTRS